MGVVFFFQAEDGIRDHCVTGVQTCALPIFGRDGAVVQSAPESALPWAEYMRLLSRSKIGVSVRGLGYDTYRYWEIPYAGTLLLAETPQTVIPENFVDGREAVFAPVEQLADRARDLLRTDTREITDAGRRKLLATHTSVHRA